jgi:UMF1 family MFS transporter
MTPEERKKPPLSATISWILYDFANTAYSMNVVSLYFVTWVIIELGQRDAVVAIANSISMIMVAFTLPVLGDYSDCKGKKMISLAFFTALCIAGTVFLGKMGGLGFGAFYVPVIVLIYILANYGYQGGLVFYNALMPSISTTKTIGRISGYGVALGYLGAIVGLIVARIFVDGEFFGISIPGIAAGGPTAAFVPTAIIFFVFADQKILR